MGCVSAKLVYHFIQLSRLIPIKFEPGLPEVITMCYPQAWKIPWEDLALLCWSVGHQKFLIHQSFSPASSFRGASKAGLMSLIMVICLYWTSPNLCGAPTHGKGLSLPLPSTRILCRTNFIVLRPLSIHEIINGPWKISYFEFAFWWILRCTEREFSVLT